MTTSLVPRAPIPDPDSENTLESPASQGSGGGETEEDMQAAPTQKARPVGLEQPPSTNVDSTNPKGRKARRKAKSAAEKAITLACSSRTIYVTQNRAHSSTLKTIDIEDLLLDHLAKVAKPSQCLC